MILLRSAGRGLFSVVFLLWFCPDPADLKRFHTPVFRSCAAALAQKFFSLLNPSPEERLCYFFRVERSVFSFLLGRPGKTRIAVFSWLFFFYRVNRRSMPDPRSFRRPLPPRYLIFSKSGIYSAHFPPSSLSPFLLCVELLNLILSFALSGTLPRESGSD